MRRDRLQDAAAYPVIRTAVQPHATLQYDEQTALMQLSLSKLHTQRGFQDLPHYAGRAYPPGEF